MKSFRIIKLALIAIILCLVACSGGGDDPIKPTPKPEIIKSEIIIDSNIISNGLSFSNEKGEQTISFSTNENWTLSVASTTSGVTWCTTSTTSGNKGQSSVKFSVLENTSYDNRSVSVTIKSGTATKTFTISQKCVDALLVTTDKYEISQEGGSIDIEVKANINYKMEISEKAKEWIKESSIRALNTYKHTLIIEASEEVEKREGEIYFKSGDKVETVKVYQAGGAILLLSKNEYTISDKGDTISVEIKSNTEFGIEMPNVEWIINEASSRGLSSHKLNYIIKANEEYDNRSAEIIFYDKNSDLKDTVKIVQAQKDAIIIAKNEYTIESAGGNLDFEINTNVDFEVKTSVDWIKQNTSSRALETKPLSFTITENTEDEKREGLITISHGDLKQEIKVIQKAKSVFSLSKTEFNVSSDGGDFKVEVSTNGEYTVTMPNATWIKEITSRATSTYTHTFNVATNETYDAREAEITFTHKETNEEIKVKIIQAQKDAIIIAKNEYTIESAGGNLDFEINTNVDFEVKTSVDWIKQNTSSRALETKPLSFTITENTEDEKREGLITISHGDLKQEIKVIQKAKSVFSLSKTEFNVSSDGGDFKIEVSTNGEYTVTMPNATWLKEIKSRATSTYAHTFNVSANETYDAREGEITFTKKETNEEIKVKVIQAQNDAIIIAKNEYIIKSAGETIEVELQCNFDYDIFIQDDWIKQVEKISSRAIVSSKLYFQISKNKSNKERIGKIIITNKNTQNTEIITLTQKYNENDIPYITFTADYKQSLSMSRTVETLEYSVNGENWEELGTKIVDFGGKLGELRLRGYNQYGTGNNNVDYSKIIFDNDENVTCTGDIRTLIKGESYANVNTSARFPGLFSGCTQLVSAPELPATKLEDYCYYKMFYGCKNLQYAPKLSAMTMKYHCYESMFAGCTSLTAAPELPATNLYFSCYDSMFSGCSSLTKAPQLPATTLWHYCYQDMFAGCKSLTTAPELPATKLAEHCYDSMFMNCENLTKAPKLPATILNTGCYQNMFAGCISLTEAPELPATILADYCYRDMFSNCSKLNKVIIHAVDVSAIHCLVGWLYRVAPTGTIIKSKSMNSLYNVPDEWIIKNYGEE